MTETIVTLPQNNNNFVSDTIAFLANEDAERFDRQFAGFVSSGGTAPTSGSLSHTILALEAFVHGYYVAQPNTLVTYTATRRTFCFVDSVETRAPEVTFSGGSGATFKERQGNLVFAECNTGSSQPTPSVDGLVALLYADTDGSNITAVTDLRLLSPIVSSTKIVDPARYGLVGDGLTDNTAAFQMMVDGLPLGSVIRFGQGVYLFTSITLAKGCYIEGIGGSLLGSVLRLTNATATGLNVTATDPVTLKSLRFDAGVTRSAGYAVLFSGDALSCSVEDVVLVDQFHGLGFTGGTGWHVDKCSFVNGRGRDIDVANGAATANVNAVISSNVFDSNIASNSSGVFIRKAIGLSIFGNRFIGHDFGIVCDPEVFCAGIDIHDNTFRDQTNTPIHFTRTSGSAVVQLFKIKANLIGNSLSAKLINIGNGVGGIYFAGIINENGLIGTLSSVIGIDLSSDSGCIVSENNIQVPNGGGDTAICIRLGTTSNAANIGHNGYVGKTFVSNLGATGASIIPLFIVTGTIAIDPSSITGGTTVEVTAAVSGVVVGDVLVLSRPAAAQLPLTIAFVGCRVSATDQISVFLHNITGSPIDPGSADWSGFVIRDIG